MKERKNVCHMSTLLQTPLLSAAEPGVHVFSAHALLPLPPSPRIPQLASLHTALLVLPQTCPLCKSKSQWRSFVYRQNFILWLICPNILFNERPLCSGGIKSVGSRVRESRFPSQLDQSLTLCVLREATHCGSSPRL